MWLKELLNTTLFNGAVLAAGASGIYNNCVLLTADYSPVERKETLPGLDEVLLLYTGRPQGMDMRTYLDEKIGQKAAGILFLSSTPEEAGLDAASLDLCSRANFPVVLLPSRIDTKTLLQQSIPYFASHSSHTLGRSALLKEICLQNRRNITKNECAQLNYDANMHYCALIFQLCGRENDSSFENQAALLQAQNLLMSALAPSCSDYMDFFDLTRQVCFLPYSPKTRWSAVQKKIKDAFQKAKDGCQVPFRVGVGVSAHYPDELCESFQAAVTAVEVGGRIRKTPRVCLFEAAFPYKIILSSPESELRQYMQIYIGPILDHPDYIKTLREYYGGNMNLKETANNLGIHVNTLRSRLETIAFLLDTDLKKPEVRTSLTMALTILHYFEQGRQ